MISNEMDPLVVNSGAAALDLIARQSSTLDMILMDINMPEMDGCEATRRLRDGGYTRPILALTANAMLADVERCRQAGCDEHLAKPIDRHRLLQTIAAYVKRKTADLAASNQIVDPQDSEAASIV